MMDTDRDRDRAVGRDRDRDRWLGLLRPYVALACVLAAIVAAAALSWLFLTELGGNKRPDGPGGDGEGGAVCLIAVEAETDREAYLVGQRIRIASSVTNGSATVSAAYLSLSSPPDTNSLR